MRPGIYIGSITTNPVRSFAHEVIPEPTRLATCDEIEQSRQAHDGGCTYEKILSDEVGHSSPGQAETQHSSGEVV